MHETSLVDSLFDQIDAAVADYPAARLALVEVKIGALAGVEPQLFVSAFEGLRSERGHPDAQLRVTWSPANWQCRDGHSQDRAQQPTDALTCPLCDAPLHLVSGDEIILQHLELEPAMEIDHV